jgi:hypothetical protein
MPINHESKTLFVHIPKCGGTSVEKLLDMSYDNNFYTYKKKASSIFSKLDFSKFTLEERAEVEEKNLQHCTYRELKKLLPVEVFTTDYYIFSIVRNPYTRIVSEYFYLAGLVTRIPELKPFTQQFPTVSDFVLYGLSLPKFERISKYDGHLETQCDYLLDTSLEDIFGKKAIKIYKFETDMEDVMNMAKRRADIDVANIKAREGLYNKTVDYLNNEAKDAVYQFYKNDFELFGYTKL